MKGGEFISFIDSAIIVSALQDMIDGTKDVIMACLPVMIVGLAVWKSPKIVKRVVNSIFG